MKQKFSLLIMAFALTVFFSCKDTKPATLENGHVHNKEHEVHQNYTKDTKPDCNEVHWSHHKGNEGPENWKNLCDGFSDCGGTVQSPVNINTQDVVINESLDSIQFEYTQSPVEIINNGHTVQFNVSGDNKVNIADKEYNLLQFHYHTKSEHTINGDYFPMEVHFVHRFSDTDYAVIGILFKEGAQNKLLSNYLDKFPKKNRKFDTDETIDLMHLLPSNKSYYSYKGSLTTPPCSEVVNWYVMKTPMTASKEQLDQFSKILNSNYRPIQALNNRKVQLYNTK